MATITMEQAIEKGKELQKKFFNTEEAARSAVDSLIEEAPEDFRARNLSIEKRTNETGKEIFLPNFYPGEVVREIVIGQEPDPENPFTDWDVMKPMEIVSFSPRELGSTTKDYGDYISREELLGKLWEETNSSNLSFESRIEDYCTEFYHSLNDKKREEIYQKYVLDQNKKWIRNEIEDKVRNQLINGLGNDYRIRDWVTTESYNSKKFREIINQRVDEEMDRRLQAFRNKDSGDQVKSLIQEDHYCCEPIDFAYAKLLSDVKQNWIVVPLNVKGCPGYEHLDMEKPTYEEYEKCDGVLIARKDEYIATRFPKNEVWADEKHLDQVLSIIKNDLEFYDYYRNGNVWHFEALEDDEVVESVGGYYGEIENILGDIRKDLPEEFLELLDSEAYETRYIN